MTRPVIGATIGLLALSMALVVVGVCLYWLGVFVYRHPLAAVAVVLGVMFASAVHRLHLESRHDGRTHH